MRLRLFVLLMVACAGTIPAHATVAAVDRPAATSRLISLYDQGVERTYVSDADTVQAALGDAGVTVGERDAVEPALATRLVAKAYHINVYRARPVTVVDGTVHTRLVTAEQSPRQIVAAAGSTLYDEDTTHFEQVSSVLEDGGAGLRLVLHRATPFTFRLYGKTITARTQAATVGAMLREKHIVLAPEDGSDTASGAPIVAGMSIAVWRNGVQTISEELPIAFATEKIQDKDHDIGYKAIQTTGKPGKRLATFVIDMRDGTEVSRKEIQSVTTLEPIKQVEVVGARLTTTFSGAFSEALARLRQCEAGGRYDRNSGNGYYGAYQYDITTWGNYMGYANASLAPGEVQDQKVWETYQRRGWQPWPACTRSQGLQDTYR